MLLVTQIYAPQNGGISLIKRFFGIGYVKSHFLEKYCSYLMSCKIYTPYMLGDPQKVLPFDNIQCSLGINGGGGGARLSRPSMISEKVDSTTLNFGRPLDYL